MNSLKNFIKKAGVSRALNDLKNLFVILRPIFIWLWIAAACYVVSIIGSALFFINALSRNGLLAGFNKFHVRIAFWVFFSVVFCVGIWAASKLKKLRGKNFVKFCASRIHGKHFGRVGVGLALLLLGITGYQGVRWQWSIFEQDVVQASRDPNFKPELKAFLRKHPAVVHFISQYKFMTAAELAMIHGDPNFAEFLLSTRPGPEGLEAEFSHPIYVAAGTGSRQMVDYLLARGVDINLRWWGESTPLFRAALLDQPEMIRYLVSRGAKIGLMDDLGRTALDQAVVLGNDKSVIALLETEIDAGKAGLGSIRNQYLSAAVREYQDLSAIRHQVIESYPEACHQAANKVSLMECFLMKVKSPAEVTAFYPLFVKNILEGLMDNDRHRGYRGWPLFFSHAAFEVNRFKSLKLIGKKMGYKFGQTVDVKFIQTLERETVQRQANSIRRFAEMRLQYVYSDARRETKIRGLASAEYRNYIDPEWAQAEGLVNQMDYRENYVPRTSEEFKRIEVPD